MKTFADLPKFKDLEDKRRYWEWGPAGSYEEGLGKLNLLTPDIVAKAAASEIRTGERAGLSWELNQPDVSQFNRPPAEHKIQWCFEPLAFDDTLAFNPQSTSQWDGFRHHALTLDPANRYIKAVTAAKEHGIDGTVEFYGGTKASEILEPGSTRIGVQFWAKKGIVGRGVLVDYYSYAKKHGKEYDPVFGSSIPFSDLKQCIDDENIQFQPGDIFILRTGFIDRWLQLTADEKEKISKTWPPAFTGLEPSPELLEFLWDNHFTACVGDAIAFEQMCGTHPDIDLHMYLLAGWGVPIGELFYLDEIAEICKKQNRHSFFFSAIPLNIPGGVSSTPNAIAIF